MPYIAKLEKAGIPTVVVDYQDQEELIKETLLRHGVTEERLVHASHTLPGPADVDSFIQPMLEALTKPLTKKEKESARWAPPQPRILFEGTLGEAQTFYQQTRYIPPPLDAPIALYTDGFPIIVPTEELVQEMLKGTSHKPEEVITYPMDGPVSASRRGEGAEATKKKGEPVRFENKQWTATVEKVATIAVMAGCKPEYLPVVLAIAQSGCPTGSQGNAGYWACVSGPIAKEIGMNAGVGLLNPGNPANATIGRTYQLMAINLGGALTGESRLSNHGNPFNTGGVCFAENADGLPSGWLGLNEEYDFRKGENVVMVSGGGNVRGANTPPGGFRALQKSGHGGVARRLNVKGIPGPHNWLEYMVPDIWADHDGGYTFLMIPQMAQDLYNCGFTSKEAVYEWLYKKSFLTVKEYRDRGGGDLSTNGWMGIERTSGKHWKELSDDYMVPLMNDPAANNIIICGGTTEFVVLFNGRQGGLAPYNVFSIDAWR
ncbi:MAG: hypothetical protein HYX80_08835 [Chloroflexi bacterium]|nr:hypothetical protein [Chloroflexota bacterium]